MSELRNLSQCQIGTGNFELDHSKVNIELIPPIKQCVLTCDQIDDLKKMYSMLYPSLTILHVQRVSLMVQKISVAGEIISSIKGNNSRNSCILAIWKSPEDSKAPERQIGSIQHILKNKISTNEGQKEHNILAVVNWHKKHPDEIHFGSLCYVVQSDVLTESSMCYIPVHRLLSRCCFGSFAIDLSTGREKVVVAIPIALKFIA